MTWMRRIVLFAEISEDEAIGEHYGTSKSEFRSVQRNIGCERMKASNSASASERYAEIHKKRAP